MQSASGRALEAGLADRRPSGIPFGAATLTLAIPLLCLHGAFQPTVHLHAAGLGVRLRLVDATLVLVAAGAVVEARRGGIVALRHGALVWAAVVAFLLDVAAATFYPLAWTHAYPWRTHLVTAVKYAEYGVLAFATPLAVRRARDLRMIAWALVLVGAAATLVGVLQFAGVHIFRAWPSGGRQPSFVGVDDYGALSAAVYVVGAALVALGSRDARDRTLAVVACLAGGVGMVLSGALASVLGMTIAVVVLAAVAWRTRALTSRRGLALAGLVVVVACGSVFMRSSALGSFARFLGVGRQASSGRVESYSQRWVLDYVGLRIFERRPVLGAGWQAAFDQETYGPVLPAAHRRFPSQPPQAFPSPAHPYGIQNAYVEALAELGIVGALLFAAWIASGLIVGARGALAAPHGLSPPLLGLLFVCVALGVWNGLWFIAGNPFDALLWLGFGLAATTPDAA